MAVFCWIFGHNDDGYESYLVGNDAVSRTWCTRCGTTVDHTKEPVVIHYPGLRELFRKTLTTRK